MIKLEELYGLSSCKFNVHCLTHLPHCVKDCGPLWATSAFTFESHNHVLMNMFSGTQCVPQQIVDTFLLKAKVASLTKCYVNADSSPCVKKVLSKLTDNSRFAHNISGTELTFLGSGKLVVLDARMIVALEDLLGLTLVSEHGKMYERFLYNHQLYSSVSYVRSKQHTNHSVSIQHPSFTYGIILGQLDIKPLCCCTTENSQYCNCTHINVVMVKPMHANQRSLFRDVDFKVTSYFIFDVEETDNVIAVYPSQIMRKCISVHLGDKTYFCPLPYRINDD